MNDQNAEEVNELRVSETEKFFYSVEEKWAVS
jgi:hypothetical protein